MMDDTITVIVNTYNDRAHVGRAIQSVLTQTLKPHEIVVIDDGSSDGTGEFLQREFGKRILYHYHPNRGLPASRNVGFELSSGRWLAFIDSDDYWAEEKLELTLAETLGRPEVGMVACAGFECTPEDKVLCTVGFPQPYSMDVVRSELRRRNPFIPSGAMIRRDVLQQVGGWPEDMRYAEDIVTFARIAACYEIAAVHRPLFYKTVLPTSMQFDAEKVLHYGPRSFQMCKEALGRTSWPGRWLDEIAYRQGVTQVFLHAAWVYSGRHETRRAASCILRGLLKWPFLTARQYRSIYWLCANLLQHDRQESVPAGVK
jgi:glycosyltransferase involved in cell wall biosynthesis